VKQKLHNTGAYKNSKMESKKTEVTYANEQEKKNCHKIDYT
jgi:hypothetical protein